MANKQTNYFEGDIYLASSTEPSIYGNGSISIAGTSTSTGYLLNGATSGTISILAQSVTGTYNFNLPTSSGTNGQVLTSTGGGVMSWTTPAGTGTVTSIALSAPSFLTVSGSPITSSGTISLSFSGIAIPILNGGTGSTTATGSGSVVLQTSPSLTTPNIGVASGTSLSVTGNINSLTHTLSGSTSGVITIQAQTAAGTYNFNLPTSSGITGQVLTSGGGGSNAMTWTDASGIGTVTSVGVTAPAFLTVTGSPITTSGNITLSFSGSAIPIANGGTGSTTSTGTGSVVLQNSPSLNTPNIGISTGTSLSVTGNLNSATHTFSGSSSGIITIVPQAAAGTYNFNLPSSSGSVGQVLTSGGGASSPMTWTTPTTGTVTSVSLATPAFLSVSGSPITSSGTITLSLSGTAIPITSGGTGSVTATGSGSVVLQNSPALSTPNIGIASGASLSVTGNINSLSHTLTGSTSGVITIQTQAAAGTYNFNLPSSVGTVGQVLTSGGGASAPMTWTTPTTGTVTSVSITTPAFLSVSGSPITTSGTITLSLSGTAIPITSGGTGSTTATGSGSVVLQTSPTLTTPNIGVASGTSLSVSGNINSLSHTITGSTSGVITIQGQAVAGTYNFNLPTTSGTVGQVLTSGGGASAPMTWTSPGGGGTVTSVALIAPAFLTVSGSPITSSGTITLSLSGTAIPITSGGTGSTTATGSGSVVLQTSPTLTTPNIGIASGTSLSVTGNINSLSHTITGSTSGVITIQGQAAAGTYNFNLPTTSGTAGQVLTSGGGASAPMTWTSPGGTILPRATIRDEKSSGTQGGNVVGGTNWAQRNLNVINAYPDTQTNISISANDITLVSGTYSIVCECPAVDVDLHQARLFNVTDNTTTLLGSSSSHATANNTGYSVIRGIFTISTIKVFRVEHRCQTTRINGFGLAVGAGTEIYTQLDIQQLA